MRFLCLVPVALLGLGGCEKPIGTYRIDKTALVAATEPAMIARNDAPDNGDKVIRIDFSSETDAVAAANADLYVTADDCPLTRRYGFHALGPYPDGLSQNSEADGGRHPRRDVGARYHYVAYLDPDWPSDLPQGYDLRRHPRDVCLQVNGSYMFSPPPRSKVFVLPKAALERTLAGR